MKRADVYAHALALPEKDRLDLSAELLASVRVPGIMSEDDPGFAEEIRRRMERVRSGESEGIPSEEVMASAKAIVGYHREQRAKKKANGVAKSRAAASRGRTRSRG